MTKAARGHEWEAEEGRALAEREAAGIDRRTFLQAAGFTLGAAAVSCGRGPVRYAVPYLAQPEDVVPGKATHYATTCAACPAACGVLARSRDGRPVKLEGNPEHPLSRGGLCAAGQAALLGLYDSKRAAGPLKDGSATTWAALDAEVRAALAAVRARGGRVRVLARSIASPSMRTVVGRFLATFRDARLVEYDAPSSSALLDAHAAAFGVRAAPRLRLEKARVVVVFDSDLLGTGVAGAGPVETTAAWAETRDPTAPDRFSWYAQFESRFTLTGGKADRRARLAPHEVAHALAYLCRRLGGRGVPEPKGLAPTVEAALDEAAERLRAARGEAAVVCGTNDLACQTLAAYANDLVGAYGATLDLASPDRRVRGDDRAVAALLDELEAGTVDALVVLSGNPAYDLPDRARFARALEAMTREAERPTASFSDRIDETGAIVRYVAPPRHFLEAWDDAEPVEGIVTVAQPLVRPWRETRPVRETLLAWIGEAPVDDREIVRSHLVRTYGIDWRRAVHDGFALVRSRPERPSSFRAAALAGLRLPAPSAEAFEVVVYESVALRDGRQAENPWLQELPDPVTKVAWGNCASFAPETARRLGITDGDVVEIEAGGTRVEVPAHVQPGQDERTVAVALGHGRRGTARFAGIGPRWIFGRPSTNDAGVVGVDAGGLVALAGGYAAYARGAAVRPTGAKRPLAATQDHHLLHVPEGLGAPGARLRPIVRETTLAAYAAGEAGAQTGHPVHSIWEPDHRYTGHHWGMAVDLTKCTGCSACVLACQAENNVPVVGRDEVMRSREMHWLRIDRYYSAETGEPDVAFQPMTCHHCDHAPCETVCPVLATVHSSEGLNQQVYNRCVGTRYCANNCPYKVRRFNWFDYAHDDAVANLALNPDIVVRSRGVMEKCSFCIQRIQEARARARAEGRPIGGDEVRPACVQSCPARAIVFGDMNDPNSGITKARLDDRHYVVLDELNLKPSLGYLAVVRNRDKAGPGAGEAGGGGGAHV